MSGPFILAGIVFGLASGGLIYQAIKILLALAPPNLYPDVGTAWSVQVYSACLQLGIAAGLAAVILVATGYIIASLDRGPVIFPAPKPKS